MDSTPPQSDQNSRHASPVVTSGRVVAVLLAVVAIVFIAQNRDRVTVNLFTIDVTAPVWLILTVMVVLGLAVGALLRGRR